MKLVFEGLVELGDGYRCYDDELSGSVHVGGKDVVGEICEVTFEGTVTIGIADESFSGDLFVETGWGYSEWTPVDTDSLTVGPHNILAVLSRYEGQNISLFISDEPIDILEELTDEESQELAESIESRFEKYFAV